ncbi:MAG: hypothetical protein ACI4DN_03405 [Lachnospiraceae bacterium]
MKKRKIILAMIIWLTGCMVLGMGISAAATGTGRRANLKSAGSIDVQIDNQEIYISSSDFRYLADEIDTLENTYKMNIVDALNSIGSYFKADGTVVYEQGLNEVTASEEKTALSFKNLKDAIEASQSVVSLSQTQATDKDGRLLFYKDKVSSDSKNLLNTTTTNTGYPVYYQAVKSENLSAGTAAWVDGELIKGKGSDNVAFYNQGVAAGEANSKVGTATADKVLSGYTFTNATGVGIAGTMVNRGTLNWNPTSSTTQTIQPGYYSGGTLNSSGAYQEGFNKGKEQAIQNASIVYTYHTHDASCKTTCTGMRRQTHSLADSGSGITYYYASCNTCSWTGAGTSPGFYLSSERCTSTISTCPKREGEIDSATITYN